MQNTRVLLARHLARQRHADGDAQALPQRAARYLDARQLQPVRMPLERRVQLAQRDHVFQRVIAGQAQAEIERGSLVSARPDDAVAVFPVGHVGIVVGDLQVQGGDDLHHGERSAGVSRTGGAQRHQVVAAHQAGGLFEFFDRKIAHNGFGECIHERHVVSFLRARQNFHPALASAQHRTIGWGSAHGMDFTRYSWDPIHKARPACPPRQCP